MQFFKPTRWKVIIAVLLVILCLSLDDKLYGDCANVLLSGFNFSADAVKPNSPFCDYLFSLPIGLYIIINFLAILSVPFSYLISCAIVFFAHKLKKQKKK